MIPEVTASLPEEECFYVISYYRLSKQDRNKHEQSDSIANQRKLIQAYIDNHPNLILVDEAFDDGYTGTNFDRPGFQKVLDAIQSGQANCVIVKDLSRLGREYISTGNLIDSIFPDLGVRFIAINDDVDSQVENDGNDILIPIKNIMNESYCRDLSKKLRRQFRIQRSNGEYLGAFASYGYCKSPEDKHKLILDEYAASVVRGIFSLWLKGYSQYFIADYLNEEMILPPAEYKRSLGLNYKTGYSSSGEAKWTHFQVTRILRNPLYAGVLIQGKRGTPNFKVKVIRTRKESEWSVVKNNHPAIIDPTLFELIQVMLDRDTRSSPSIDRVMPLSGVLYCPDCGRLMTKRTVTRSGKKFSYYVCSGYKKGLGCSGHSIECNKLETIVMNAIAHQVNVAAELDALIKEVGNSDVWKAKISRLDVSILQKKKELDEYYDFRRKLYEAFCDDLIDREEYDRMHAEYKHLISEAEAALRNLTAAKEEAIENTQTDNSWLSLFVKFQGLEELSREVIVTLVDKVYVHDDKHVRIEFNFRDEIQFYLEAMKADRLEVS